MKGTMMKSGRTWIIVGGAVAAAVVIAAVVAWIQGDSFQQAQPTERVPTRDLSAMEWQYHLRPLEAQPPDNREAALAAWEGIFEGMAKDPETAKLLRRLHGGFPVELTVIDAQGSRDNVEMLTPPGEGFSVAIRVGDFRTSAQKIADKDVFFRVIAYHRVLRLKQPDPPSAAVINDPNVPQEPWIRGSLALAMDDYMLRHAPGWAVFVDSFVATQGLSNDPAAHRELLDQRAENYSKRAKAYYGSLLWRPGES